MLILWRLSSTTFHRFPPTFLLLPKLLGTLTKYFRALSYSVRNPQFHPYTGHELHIDVTDLLFPFSSTLYNTYTGCRCCSGSNYATHSGDFGIKSRPGYRIHFEVCLGFPQTLLTNTGLVSRTKPLPFPSRHIPLHPPFRHCVFWATDSLV
jgi:hypothetical protein